MNPVSHPQPGTGIFAVQIAPADPGQPLRIAGRIEHVLSGRRHEFQDWPGLLDCLMWPAGMVTTTITVTALQGHHAGLKTEVIAAVTLANFAGSSAAVRLGRRFIKARRE